MVDMENTVAVTQPDSVSADAVQDQETVETEQSALEQFLMEAEPEQDAETEGTSFETEQTQEQDETPVSKGIKGRIQAAEAKADRNGYDRGRAEVQREFEAYKAEINEKLREFEEYKLDKEARELAAKEKCSVDFAKRLIRAEKGLPTFEKPVNTPVRAEEATRHSQPQNSAEEMAKTLMAQAQSIQKTHGVDTLEIFKNDPEVRKKVGSGEWDMRDVLIHSVMKNKSEQKTASPKPIHASGSRSYEGGIDFNNMTDAQYDQFRKRIINGAVYRPK